MEKKQITQVLKNQEQLAETHMVPNERDGEDRLTLPNVLPILPLANTVVYPSTVQPLAVSQERSLRLISDVIHGDRLVALVAQKSPEVEQLAGPHDLYTIGIVARIVRAVRMPDSSMQMIVLGLERVEIGAYTQEQPYLVAHVTPKPDPQDADDETEAIKRNVIASFQRYLSLIQNASEAETAASLNMEEACQVVYIIASLMPMEITLRQQLLELDSARAKLERLSSFLAHELDILELGRKIRSSTEAEMGKKQREYMLREQLKAIQRELGEESQEQATINELHHKIDDAKMPEEALKAARHELSRLEQMPSASPEYGMIHTYLELLVSLPWMKSTGEKIDLPHARLVLDQDHYDLDKVKERILEYLAVRHLKEERRDEHIQRSKDMAMSEGGTQTEKEQPAPPSQEVIRQLDHEPILCFVGPPGVGKTSLGQSIARALGRKFARMSLGGIRDEAEIRGHRRTYIGAMPGRILETLRRVETNDPVIMLDEVDKLGADWRGDPSSALLEVLDPEQNYTFQDNYLDLPFDLSKVMFITTANALEPIPPALRDRMEVLELSGYTEEQKLHIARTYLLPKQLAANGLKPDELSVDDAALHRIAGEYTREAGVRNLEREMGSLCRKVARQITEGRETPIHVTAEMVPEYLGRQLFFEDAAERIDRPGIATGLVWTPVGGQIIFIEAAAMPDNESQLTLTGQLGEVMKESATAALSYVRSNAAALGLPQNIFKTDRVHIHVPAGAVPKDGPSAGVTMVTVLVSLASGRKVRSDVAMTGEITLRGKVLPIGGVKEKVLAAYRSGICTVILPMKNAQELMEDLPKELCAQMHFVYANDIKQVLDAALEPAQEQEKGEKAGEDLNEKANRRIVEKVAAQAH